MLMPLREAQDEALRALAHIRTTIECSTRYSTFSAFAVFLAAAAGLAGSGLGGWWADWPGARPEAGWPFVWTWMAVFALAASGAVTLTWLKARRRGEAAWTPIVRSMLAAATGPGLAGLAATVALVGKQNWAMLPGAWLTFYGCALYGASFFAPLFFRVLGLAFVALGLAAWWSPASLAGLWLGAGFGGLHLVFGAIVVARYRE